MHKGKITRLGRIMAGSHAISAHHEAGQALCVAYYPPDRHLSQVIVGYCQKVALATGSTLFVIDRAVNAVAMACAFHAQDLGLLCMLDDNEHDGLESFEATEVGTRDDGTKVYSGPWNVSRPDDPRHFVIVEPAEGKTLVYWGTPKVQDALETTDGPRVYRERNEMPENRFKRMIDHGARDTNYGRKTIVGPDRHQQRARAKLDQSLEATRKRVDKKAEAVKAHQATVAESASKGHGTRLEPRQQALGGGTATQGCPAPTRATDRTRLTLGAAKGAGGSRLPQADAHDVAYASIGKRADGLHGCAVWAPAGQGESRWYRTPPL